MRLTRDQQAAIRSAIDETFGEGTDVWLFGSRADDSKRGGDIDLLIKTSKNDVAEIVRSEIAFLARVKMKLGEQKIDLLVDYPERKNRPAIFEIAARTGVPL